MSDTPKFCFLRDVDSAENFIDQIRAGKLALRTCVHPVTGPGIVIGLYEDTKPARISFVFVAQENAIALTRMLTDATSFLRGALVVQQTCKYESYAEAAARFDYEEEVVSGAIMQKVLDTQYTPDQMYSMHHYSIEDTLPGATKIPVTKEEKDDVRGKGNEPTANTNGD